MNYRHLMTCLAGIFFAATLSQAQTATCTNWKTFNLPSPWIRTMADGINKYSTVVGYTYDPGQNTEGFIHYPDGSFKLYKAPNSAGTQLSRRNAQGAVDPSGRVAFMATAGLLADVLFLALIALTTAGVIALGSCEAG